MCGGSYRELLDEPVQAKRELLVFLQLVMEPMVYHLERESNEEDECEAKQQSASCRVIDDELQAVTLCDVVVNARMSMHAVRIIATSTASTSGQCLFQEEEERGDTKTELCPATHFPV